MKSCLLLTFILQFPWAEHASQSAGKGESKNTHTVSHHTTEKTQSQNTSQELFWGQLVCRESPVILTKQPAGFEPCSLGGGSGRFSRFCLGLGLGLGPFHCRTKWGGAHRCACCGQRDNLTLTVHLLTEGEQSNPPHDDGSVALCG